MAEYFLFKWNNSFFNLFIFERYEIYVVSLSAKNDPKIRPTIIFTPLKTTSKREHQKTKLSKNSIISFGFSLIFWCKYKSLEIKKSKIQFLFSCTSDNLGLAVVNIWSATLNSFSWSLYESSRSKSNFLISFLTSLEGFWTNLAETVSVSILLEIDCILCTFPKLPDGLQVAFFFFVHFGEKASPGFKNPFESLEH